MSWQLYVDGASRGNPGEAGAGIYIAHNKQLHKKYGFYLGKKTNNQAEYLALLLGLSIVLTIKPKNDHLEIYSDSELLVKQIQGSYRVRHPLLIPLYTKVYSLLQRTPYTITHVLRHNNTLADLLANDAIDQRKNIPESLKKQTQELYGINL